MLWQRIRQWLETHATSNQGATWLGVLSFAESIFSPLPNDSLMIAMLLVNSRRWALLATVATLCSVAGALVGYLLAYYFFDALIAPLIALYGAAEDFAKVQAFFAQSLFGFTLIGAITPIPYKIFVATAGFMQAQLVTFLVASLIGRGVRFFGVAYVIHRFGPQGVDFVRRYALHLTVIGVALVLVYIVGYIFL